MDFDGWVKKKLKEMPTQEPFIRHKRGYESDQDRVLSIVAKTEKRGKKTTFRIIRQYTAWKVTECQRVLDTMVADGKLVCMGGISGVNRVIYYTNIGIG